MPIQFKRVQVFLVVHKFWIVLAYVIQELVAGTHGIEGRSAQKAAPPRSVLRGVI